MLETTQIKNGCYRINFNHKRLDASVAKAFRSYFQTTLKQNYPHIILDLSKVDWIDSNGFGLLAAVQKPIIQASHQLTFIVSKPKMRQLFEMTGFDQVSKVYRTVEEALNDPSLSKPNRE